MPDDRLLDYPNNATPGTPIRRRQIHSTAIIHENAKLQPGVQIGPYSMVGPNVTLGRSVTVGGHVAVGGRTSIGAETSIFPFSSVGSTPQVRKTHLAGKLEIGSRVTIREYCNLCTGSDAESKTVLHDDVFLMAYSHVGHDCRIGRSATLANGVNLGGYVEVGSHAFIGGMVGVHQFCRLGAHVMISGGAMVLQDIPPFCLAAGAPARIVGLNLVGLRRSGFESQRVLLIKRMFQILFPRRSPLAAVIARIQEQIEPCLDRETFVQFLQRSSRGIAKL